MASSHCAHAPTVLHYLRARATASESLYLPADEATRLGLIAEARYYMLVSAAHMHTRL